jgi:formylglycine-generating enzyme
MVSRLLCILVIFAFSNTLLAVSAPQKTKEPSEMVTVEGGAFLYQNKTMLNLDTFKIDKYEITNEFYCKFLNDADPCGVHYDSQMQIARGGSMPKYAYTVKPGKGNFPICFVTAEDAAAFAAWRSKVYGGTYSLPNEQQWEKAAGWDQVLKKMFKYGYHADVIDQTWCNYNNNRGVLPVGSFSGKNGRKDAKNFYGCYDMSGNVWEWTMSPYDRMTRVIRGGGFWSDDDEFCACTARGSSNPSARVDDIGFRLVLKQ